RPSPAGARPSHSTRSTPGPTTTWALRYRKRASWTRPLPATRRPSRDRATAGGTTHARTIPLVAGGSAAGAAGAGLRGRHQTRGGGRPEGGRSTPEGQPVLRGADRAGPRRGPAGQGRTQGAAPEVRTDAQGHRAGGPAGGGASEPGQRQGRRLRP